MFGTKRVSKKVRIVLVSASCMVRAWAHTSRQAVRADKALQDARHAGHASDNVSSRQPGIESHATGSSTGLAASEGETVSDGGTTGTVGAGGRGDSGCVGVVVHDASETTMAPAESTKPARVNFRASRGPWDRRKSLMWIFVAEALLALALLIGIVWWTMGPAHKRERQQARDEAKNEAKESKRNQ